MKFEIRVKHRGDSNDKSWTEPYEKDEVTDQASADAWGENIVEYFNNTCRPGERQRELLGVVIDESTAAAVKDHDWEKTNLVTQRVRSSGRPYDAYRCNRCRITGRRFTLDGPVVRDHRYKAKAYERCDTAQQHMKKLAERRGS